VNLVRGVVDQLIEHGRVIRGWLGISMRPLDPALADAYGLDRRAMRGAVEISTVYADEPAEMAGVQAGDIVVATDGRDLDSDQDFLQRIAMTPPDDSITLDIVRVTPDDTPVGLTHESRSISVMLGERPPEIDVLADQNQGSGFTGFTRRPNLEEHELTPTEERFGMLLSELDPNLASELEYRTSDGGIVVLGVLRNGLVAEQGLLGLIVEGTIIRRVNMRPINSIADFEQLIDRFEPGDTAILDLRDPRDLTIRLAVEIPR
jgi:S1-C subfamily serine protease